VLETTGDGTLRNHRVDGTLSVNLGPSGADVNRARFNWRRLSVNASIATMHYRNNSDGPFDVPASGTRETEWGPGPAQRSYQANIAIVSAQLTNLNVNLSWNGIGTAPYDWTTGRDDNGDGLLNDRPDGVERNTLRMPGQSTLNLRAAYTLVTGQPAGGASGPRRHRIGLTFSASNLTNHANYGGYSGVMTSPFFMQPTFVVNPRRVDLGVTVGF
jgi:hypothetical protein